MIIPFHISSKRTNDITLQDNTPVAMLRKLLLNNGMDVAQARVRVLRADGTVLIGENGGYELKQGDKVIFTTDKTKFNAGCKCSKREKPKYEEPTIKDITDDDDKIVVYVLVEQD